MTDERIFQLNSEKINKHFEKYCKDMGMNINDWIGNIFLTPPCMMEGMSPKNLSAKFINVNSDKEVLISLGYYPKKGYEINLTTR